MKKLLLIGAALLSLGASHTYADKQHIDKELCELMDRSFKVFSLQEETFSWRSSWKSGTCRMSTVITISQSKMKDFKEDLEVKLKNHGKEGYFNFIINDKNLRAQVSTDFNESVLRELRDNEEFRDWVDTFQNGFDNAAVKVKLVPAVYLDDQEFMIVAENPKREG
tara:strand:+ start:5497 stop:5994 length:498 start_codon:yes stop_codon:yes gene_type:complete